MQHRVALLGVALAALPGCLYVVRGGPTLWTHPNQATVVGARGTVGAGIGEHGSGFDLHVGLGAGADVEEGDGSISGNIGLEYLRAPSPVGFRLGVDTDVRSVFRGTTDGGLGWVVPEVVGGASYLIAAIGGNEDSALAIGLEATLGFALPLNESSDSDVAMGISITLEWTRMDAFVPHAR